MFAACADRMRRDDCGDCGRRDACASLFANLFGGAAAAPPRDSAPRSANTPRNAFFAFLGEVARAIEEGSKPQEPAAPAPPPPPAAPAPEGSFRRAVEQRIEAMLERGAVRIVEIARALGTSRQTLYRRLKEEGATFEQLLDGVRRRLALRYLRKEGMAVKEAAWRLGFSDPAAFSRAFKRWTGSSPSQR